MTPTDRMAKYHILFEGEINERWLKHFDTMEFIRMVEGNTLISGFFDQAALHGVLNRLRDLGVGLISVQRINDQSYLEKDKNENK